MYEGGWVECVEGTSEQLVTGLFGIFKVQEMLVISLEGLKDISLTQG